jgi:proline iminopeptidase
MSSTTSPRSGEIPVEGGSLRYRIEGSGPPILVLGSTSYYRRTFSVHLRLHVTLVFVDPRHFGRLEPDYDPHGTSLETYVRDIERVRAEIGLGPATVLGHSHHGNLALEYARRHPDAVTRLVLVGTPPVGVRATLEAGRRYWTSRASDRRKRLLRRNRDALASSGLAESEAQAFVARYVADGPRYWYDPTFDASPLWEDVPMNMKAIGTFRGLFEDFEMDSVAQNLGQIPILVMAGRHDYVVPPILWDDVTTAPRRLSLYVLDRSGHTPQLEEPEVFDRILLEWLDGGTAPRERSAGGLEMTLLLLTLVLVAPSLLFGAADALVPGLGLSVWTGAKAGITLLLLLAGSGHFAETEGMARMLPPWVPFRVSLVHVTGVLELLGAIGLWIPTATHTVGLLLVVMLALFLPVNVYAAFKHVPFGGHGRGPAYLLARVPFQLLLMAWIWASTRARP